ncbi:HigA family addiction module antitoxin [Roseiterribacter gracilis]
MSVSTEDASAVPSGPADLLRHVMKEHRISQRALAAALKVTVVTAHQLQNGDRRVTPQMAVRLEKAMPGTSALEWLDMQARMEIAQARAELQDTLGEIPVLVPVAEIPVLKTGPKKASSAKSRRG